LTLANLPINVPVKFSVETTATGADGKIISLTVNQSVTNKSGTGTVAAWNAGDLTSLQVKDAAGATDNYPVASTATLKYNNANLALDQLVVGDAITYEVKNGSVTSIVVTKKVQPPIEAKVESVVNGKTIQYTSKGELGVKYLADNVVVKLEGLSSMSLDDLFPGDDVSLTLDGSGKVSLITITGRVLEFATGATVTTYLGTQNVLIVEDPSKKNEPLPLVINDKTRFDLNGTKITRKEAEPYITVGKKVDVGYTRASAAYISIVTQYTGTVVENNVAAKTLKLALDNKNIVTLSYPYYFAVEIYGQSSTSYLDVRVGDRVTTMMDPVSMDRIVNVQLQKTVQFDLVSIDVAANKLRAKRADGGIEEWNLNTILVSLVDEKDAPISLSALNQMNATLLNVTFKGRTAIKIKAVSTAVGRVSSVNAASSSIDIVTPSGAVVTKSFATAPVVMKDTSVLGSLSAVKADDRVEVRFDENDRTVIQIIPAIQKTVHHTDSNLRTVTMFKSNLNESNNEYSLHPQAYIHQGTKTLTLTELKQNDVVSIYVVRGKAFEIVK
jgi:hypothetical protein